MTDGPSNKIQSDRELLQNAANEGKLLGAFIRLSGPGWLQSAITLGGGSLAGALFLGVLGGTSMIWLQLMAIFMGVVMLSAISYVTLSTGRRPFEAINSEINPALGWSWVIATCMANMIWCMPQFSLAYDALDKNLFSIGGGEGLGDSTSTRMIVTVALLLSAGFVVLLKAKEGKSAKLFDAFLKALIGMVVICFVGVVVLLAANGQLDFSQIFTGMIPNPGQWNSPAGDLAALIAGLPQTGQDYWNTTILSSQRAVMIAAAATAVGINMTFLLPYSMLSRGWDKPFRGLARFDLATGMAIPYILVTSCVVIAAASTFHAKIDDSLASNDLTVMESSPMFDSVKGSLIGRIDADLGAAAETTDEATKLEMAAKLPVEEKKLALSLVKRNAFQLSDTLAPLLGKTMANLVFGLGVFGMGFSTIIILMLINGYAFREIVGSPDGTTPFVVGCLVAGLFGASWVFLWQGDAKFWLAIFTSSFGMMLLPIAYITFFLMMNSKRILGSEKPTGTSMIVWNVLMILSVIGAIVAASAAIYEKAMDKSNPMAFNAIMGLLAVFVVALIAGHFLRHPSTTQVDA
ncbi:Natural resistance-associated macrophage protein [Rubripirellula lacrimiformis]|uniref:Natural resistance-associated macrophage protein n=1 Tax=Rubripirellula lacrimiformis TaxID=1930273 RepID=A0A517N804_9BACT|nr:divalent metal cation transporter [Rubripirellula lacrimiformis]QDT03275.1 Natural resistance-associated macrophage protein [Rubripirellula lacrimiformis]